jgi:hypothetical protein
MPLPCWMAEELTGKAYFEYVQSGQMARDNLRLGNNNAPVPGYEKFRDDDLGHWYTAECAFENWIDQNDVPGFEKLVLEFDQSHPPVFVPAGETPPQGQVPSKLLRRFAFNRLTLPPPRLDWNPKRAGNQGTFVNMLTVLAGRLAHDPDGDRGRRREPGQCHSHVRRFGHHGPRGGAAAL